MNLRVTLLPGPPQGVKVNFAFTFRTPSRLRIFFPARVGLSVMVVRPADDTTFVDLFSDPVAEPFMKEPHRYYCPDGLHPSGEGYGLWFSALMGAVPLKTLLGIDG